jgi:hypothetical protein
MKFTRCTRGLLMEKVFSENGLIASHLKGYEYRQPVGMAEAYCALLKKNAI